MEINEEKMNSEDLIILCDNLRRDLGKEEQIDKTTADLVKLEEFFRASNGNVFRKNLTLLVTIVLNIIDTYEFKLRGLKLLRKLIENVDHASLIRQNFDNLILYSLKRQFYHRDADFLSELFEVYEFILIQFKVQTVNSTKCITDLDEIMESVLCTIEFCDETNISLICLKELPRLLRILDKSVYKHRNRLVQVLIEIADYNFLESRPQKIRLSLQALDQVINLTKEKFDVSELISPLIKLMFTLNDLDKREYDSIHNEILNCLKLIYKFNCLSFKPYLDELETNSDLKPILELTKHDLNLIRST